MTLSEAEFAGFFSPRIFPGFPFQRSRWLAVAFERDNYDNTRVPEDFFVVLSDEFSRVGESDLLIKGFGEAFNQLPDGLLEVEFSWPAFRQAMLFPRYYSVDYKIVGNGGSCACWADPELTVWGGEHDTMLKVIARLGGETKLLERMLSDFYLDQDVGSNEDLRVYLHGLVARNSKSVS